MSGDMNQRVVQIGIREMVYPSPELQELQDHSHLQGNQNALKKVIDDQGYILIRKLHNREDVLAARLAILEHIKNSGENKLQAGVPWEEGVLDHRCGRGCIPFMEGRNELTQCEAVRRVLEGPRPRAFFGTLFGEEALTFDYKWIRGIHKDGFTGAHVDRVYMCWGTEELYTMWTPMDDLPIEMGTLVMCDQSHCLPGFKHLQDTYGSFDVEKSHLKGTGWFTVDPLEITKYGGQWRTTDFQAGDVLIFPNRTVHMSSMNLTGKVRLSCDTRWQPSSHKADPRYMGDFVAQGKYGTWSEDTNTTADQVTMEDMRRTWGFD